MSLDYTRQFPENLRNRFSQTCRKRVTAHRCIFVITFIITYIVKIHEIEQPLPSAVGLLKSYSQHQIGWKRREAYVYSFDGNREWRSSGVVDSIISQNILISLGCPVFEHITHEQWAWAGEFIPVSLPWPYPALTPTLIHMLKCRMLNRHRLICSRGAIILASKAIQIHDCWSSEVHFVAIK